MKRFQAGARRLVPRVAVLTAAAFLVVCGLAEAQVSYSAADIQYGAKVFASQCTVCHGATGQQVAGVDLLSGRYQRASSDNELRALLTTGITGTAMPSFRFNAAEQAGIIAYLRKGRETGAANVALGDVTRGKAVFEGKAACTSCHRVNGRGPRLAPDLSNVAALRTADTLERTLLDPAGAIQPVNRSVRAVTREGKTVTGRRLNEDTYTVQLIDEHERLVTLVKADLRDYVVVQEASMPSYKDKLTPDERADVLAYLLSLKDEQ